MGLFRRSLLFPVSAEVSPSGDGITCVSCGLPLLWRSCLLPGRLPLLLRVAAVGCGIVSSLQGVLCNLFADSAVPAAPSGNIHS